MLAAFPEQAQPHINAHTQSIFIHPTTHAHAHACRNPPCTRAACTATQAQVCMACVTVGSLLLAIGMARKSKSSAAVAALCCCGAINQSACVRQCGGPSC
jgi:hypothetical protein